MGYKKKTNNHPYGGKVVLLDEVVLQVLLVPEGHGVAVAIGDEVDDEYEEEVSDELPDDGPHLHLLLPGVPQQLQELLVDRVHRGLLGPVALAVP